MAFRIDAVQKVCGTAKFADDYTFTGMVHGVPVYTDEVHGHIESISIEKALDSPGVLSILMAKDIPGRNGAGQINQDLPLFAEDKILSYGDVIALVIAETREKAIEASKLISYEITPLERVLTVERALEEDAPIIPKGKGSNIVNHHRVFHGDPQKMIEESSLIIEESFQTPLVEHAYLEPECAVATLREDGTLDIYGSMQHPFSTRRFIASYLGRPLSSIVCHGHAVGGSFGGKDDTISVICARAALGAVSLGRPVSIRYERPWSMRESYKRNPYKMHYKVGFDQNGLIKGVISQTYADSGAYTSTTPWSTWRSAVQNIGPYQLNDIEADVYGVATNNIFTGAFRGFGSPQTNFAFEQIMDMAAEKLGLSPLDIRKKNAVVQGCKTITGQVLDTHKVSLVEVMNKTAEKIDYNNKFKRCSFGQGEGPFYGIALSASYRGASLGAEGMDFCCASLNLQFDGSLLMDVSVFENGQGAPSAMVLMVSEDLGIPPELIAYQDSSTSSIPDGGTTVASRGTLMGGGALADALKQFKAIVAKTIAPFLEAEQRDIEFRDNRVCAPNGQSFTWAEVGKKMYLERVYPVAFGTFQAPRVSWDEETGQGDAYFTYVYSSQAIEIEVDPVKKSWKILNIVATHDIGRAINKPMVEGQIHGGLAQAVGMSLTEDFLVEEGEVKSLNYSKYKVPRFTDMPEMETHIVENHDDTSPMGCKGIGEPATELLAPAIASAIYNATGQRFTSLPINLKKGLQ